MSDDDDSTDPSPIFEESPVQVQPKVDLAEEVVEEIMSDDDDSTDPSPIFEESPVQVQPKVDLAEEVVEEVPQKEGYFQRYSRSVARHPWIHLLTALVASLVLSVIGMVVGGFSVSVENEGWQSRGTFISDRHTQIKLTRWNQYDLFYDETGEVWRDLIDNVQEGWETCQECDTWSRRRLVTSDEDGEAIDKMNEASRRQLENPFIFDSIQAVMERRAEENSTGSDLDGCDTTWYTSGDAINTESHLWPVWKTNNKATSIIDPQVLRDVCEAEQNTKLALEAAGLCYGCDEGRCLPPLSIVFFAHLSVGDDDISLTCEELAEKWTKIVDEMESELAECVQAIDLKYEQVADALNESCPYGFSTTMLDYLFGQDGEDVIRYSSSIYSTIDDMEAMYDNVDQYDRALWSENVVGAYDTAHEDLLGWALEDQLTSDMILALGSALFTTLALVVHTGSCWVSLCGLYQIMISFPLSYFVYTLIARLSFFPFLNFIGIFIVYALGADDVFVATDKWKNARLEHKNASTEDIAAIALPDAAGAMFLTSITTAVAFFGTAVCPVAPLKCFAVFCGLLIVFDYLMCILMVFPALCLYDKWLLEGNASRCVACHVCHNNRENADSAHDQEEKPSLIRRILLHFYAYLHYLRWLLLAICTAALVACILTAMNMGLPDSNDVRLFKEEDSQHEQNFRWRKYLLFDALETQLGSTGTYIWGVRPADTGDHKNPEEWSQLVLDDTFDPSTEAAQTYLLGFCDDLFATEFAAEVSDSYVCPITLFDTWLQEEAVSASPSEAYISNCGGATSVPVDQENFNACIIAWSQLVENYSVLQRDGVVKILILPFQSRVTYYSPHDILDEEWNLIEAWNKDQRKIAPGEVDGMYFSSEDFWWYDTNSEMLRTAYTAAAIALGAAAFVVLASSRSFAICFFSLFTIGFILTSVTAMLVAAGWSLGFLEAICFAILIGVSVDYVIHFGHAYTYLPGKVDRSERTKYALIRMGPSLLASAFTTICSSIIMLFTVITFFEKFATILFFAILQATLGSFVVFLTLTDCFGPSEPTSLVDKWVAKMSMWFSCKKEPQDEVDPDVNSTASTTHAENLSPAKLVKKEEKPSCCSEPNFSHHPSYSGSFSEYDA